MPVDAITRVKRDVVIANRILAHNDVLDAYGHVAMRHPLDPQRYFLARSLSPAIVEESDVVEFHLDGTPVDPNEKRPLYLERYIHGGVFEKRPEVMASLHSHAEDVLPFSISKTTKLRAVIHTIGDIGDGVPTWDIRDKFGDGTTMLVTNMAQGRDLAGCLDCNRMALMRGHGFVAVGRTINDLVRMAVYVPRNARVQMNAMRLGDYIPLSAGEIAARATLDPEAPAMKRGWEFWAKEAGVGHLLDD
jgi:ribulose-5-phosphate 4-epimerase/fuculose-1-phosphate aldolase